MRFSFAFSLHDTATLFRATARNRAGGGPKVTRKSRQNSPPPARPSPPEVGTVAGPQRPCLRSRLRERRKVPMVALAMGSSGRRERGSPSGAGAHPRRRAATGEHGADGRVRTGLARPLERAWGRPPRRRSGQAPRRRSGQALDEARDKHGSSPGGRGPRRGSGSGFAEGPKGQPGREPDRPG
jgi:hypothetical protein